MARSFSDIERIVERYDTATTELDQAVNDRIGDSLDASYRNLERELRSLYPTWQSEGSLYAVQRRLLLMEQLGETLAVVRPEMQGEYEKLFTEALQISHTSGATMADELVRARDPGYPLQEFTTVPIEAVAAQARDGVQRLYRYNDNFKTAVSGVVEQGLLQGWGAEKVARMLRGNEQMQGQFGLAQLKSKAETIARTEIMSAFNTASQERYERNGLQVQVLNSPSERLCSFCLARHGNVYEVGQVSVPFHPRCRDILAPYSRKWAERGWTDDAAIAADKTTRLEEMAKLGVKPNNGPTYWEKRSGLTEAPAPAWKPEDAPPVAAARAVAPPPAAPSLRLSEVAVSAAKPSYPGDRIRGNEYRFAVKGGNIDGSDADVVVSITATGSAKAAYDVNFEVNNSFQTTDQLKKEANTLIANQVSRIFREDVASKKNGTRFSTTAAIGDDRATFREAMYAKMGFSFANGEPVFDPDKIWEGEQYGVVKNGKLVPADDNHKPFGKNALEEYRQSVRQALKDAIAKAREG